jgi:transposase
VERALAGLGLRCSDNSERRRSWTLEQKREIVAESLGSELTLAEVARKHGISTGQIYT